MKLLNRITCFFMFHQWTSLAQQGIPPTKKQLDDGLEGFYDYAKMYCTRCGYVYKSERMLDHHEHC